MIKRNKILLAIVLMGIMLLGMGYSAIANITLDVIGELTASPRELQIGDYIDLGNNIVGTEATTDDWRILYIDEETDTVYAILADYLPNSTGYAANAGLKTNSTYSVYSNTSRDTLLTGLTTETNWSGLANGVIGVTVTGSPTAELLMNSYNTKNGTSLDYTDYPQLDSSTTDYDLYVPHTSAIDNCYGYWLASSYEGNTRQVWYIDCEYYVNNNPFTYDGVGIRPVAAFPKGIIIDQEDGPWTVIQSVARIDKTYYTTLQEAFDEVPTTGEETTVYLLKNTIEKASVAEGQAITLQLDGSTVLSSSGATITNNGTLKIVEGTVQSGGVVSTDATEDSYANTGYIGVAVANYNSLEINGGNFKGARAAVSNFGSGAVVINGGEFSSETKATISNYYNGNIIVAGGTISCSDNNRNI